MATIYSTIVALVVSTSFTSTPAAAKGLIPGCGNGKGDDVAVSSEKRAGGKNFVTGKTLIKAPASVVWETVHEERKHDPDLAYSKILESGVNECRLEQKFVLIPVVGTAVCEMHNAEVPLQRIDYKLLKSDRFKAMEGSWVLTPQADGKHTLLELSTHLDMGLPVPEHFMTSATKKKLAKRLGNVKKMAESTHAKLAANQSATAQ
jgi:hypothetical protein